ncbi:CHAD domain-containing protein [Methanolobus bombayensis]|uniref:CHAD domain-containing protein n=1 Tax=Methanolobus bombayensis TaxID=38023 RepID=UPI001AE4388A|nr:CHAD domain-containing protein [Methanolobus bombayensis]MBP1909881.1 CHAD domain-containing protein [Methanolobus bombayensis]
MSSSVFIRKYSLVASLGFLTGLVFCMTGLLFAIVSRLNRGSGPEVILTVCMLLASGIVFILAGINIAGISQRLSRSYSFLAGLLLSVSGLLVFMFSFPDNWIYPIVSYAIISYSLGIFLLLINIFVNYFLQAQGENELCEDRDIDSDTLQNETKQQECSVLTTFAGIMMTNITSGSYEPAIITGTGTSDGENNYIVNNTVSEEKLPETLIMESYEEKRETEEDAENVTESFSIENTKVCNTDETHEEPIALETTQFPEIVDVPEPEITESPENDLDEKKTEEPEQKEAEYQDKTEEKALITPYSEFRSIKKTDIKADDTMRGAARKILMYHFGQMIEHERGTKVGKDIEELHDMRVAAMRMRSIIEVLEDYLNMKEMSSHYKDIKSIRKTLGTVRDLDVFLEKIDHYLEAQAPESVPEMDPLTDSILIERAKHRGTMLVYLDDPRYNKFKKKFADYLLHKKSWKMKSSKKNGEPVPARVVDVLPVLLYSQLATVRAYGDVLTNDISIDPYLEKYHQLRIDVKILRYTIEFFKEVLGSETKSLIKDLKALQDNLGDMHDTVVALEMLENFERYGVWGETHGKKNSASIRDYPGVDAYIEYRKKELASLLESFPDAWSNVIDPDFSVRFSQAIAGLYNS